LAELTFMESAYDKYEPIIGLEVHIQMLTKTKAYFSDGNEIEQIAHNINNKWPEKVDPIISNQLIQNTLEE